MQSGVGLNRRVVHGVLFHATPAPPRPGWKQRHRSDIRKPPPSSAVDFSFSSAADDAGNRFTTVEEQRSGLSCLAPDRPASVNTKRSVVDYSSSKARLPPQIKNYTTDNKIKQVSHAYKRDNTRNLLLFYLLMVVLGGQQKKQSLT